MISTNMEKKKAREIRPLCKKPNSKQTGGGGGTRVRKWQFFFKGGREFH